MDFATWEYLKLPGFGDRYGADQLPGWSVRDLYHRCQSTSFQHRYVYEQPLDFSSRFPPE